MTRTWTKVGRPAYGYVGTDRGERPSITRQAGRRRIEAAIERLDWGEIPAQLPMGPGMGIMAAVKELRLPRVSAIAISNELAPYSLYGIEANYRDGRARIYILDRGSDLLPLASDFPIEASVPLRNPDRLVWDTEDVS